MKNSMYKRMASSKAKGFGANLRRWMLNGYFFDIEHHDNDLKSYLERPYYRDIMNDDTMDIHEYYTVWSNGAVLDVYPSRKRKWLVRTDSRYGNETKLPIWKIWKLFHDLMTKGDKVLKDYGL